MRDDALRGILFGVVALTAAFAVCFVAILAVEWAYFMGLGQDAAIYCGIMVGLAVLGVYVWGLSCTEEWRS
jgi:hypothetical protein